MKSKRKLAAIMFTDIVGYTALMEESEARANQMRDRHREVFEHFHNEYEGKILRYYGDGTLSIFDSCIVAVNCARDIQLELQKTPSVPLRIGVHLGDILLTGDDVFGDGVNVASRVESMGVPGAVLISAEVQKQVVNQDIDTISIGRFRMKNVKVPVEVFAVNSVGLTLPEVQEVQGKAKRLESRSTSSSWLSFTLGIRLAVFGFIAMAVGAVLFWTLIAGDHESVQLLPQTIREEKVAIGVFENFTNDEELEVVGYLVSEWIGSGMRELMVKTVSPEMSRQNQEKIGILPGNMEGKPSFAEVTGAKYVITGSYYLQEDSILLNTRLSSAETGEVLFTFPHVITHKDQREQIADKAREYLLGYWVAKHEQELPTTRPPKYEAYKIYLTCRTMNVACYQEVLRIDPDFLLARVFLVGASMGTNNDSIYQINKAVIEQRWDQCTEYEKHYFNSAVSYWEGDVESAYRAVEAMYELDSNDYSSLHLSAWYALVTQNMPNHAIKKWDGLFDKIEGYEKQILDWSYEWYLNALNRVEDYQKAIDFYEGLTSTQKKTAGLQSSYYMMRALIHQNRIDDALNLIGQQNNKAQALLRAAYIFKYIHMDSISDPFSPALSEHLLQFEESPTFFFSNLQLFNWNSRAMAYYVLGKWQEAEATLSRMEISSQEFDQTFKSIPDGRYWEKMWYIARLGCIYAHQGKKDQAQHQIKAMDQLGGLYPANPAATFFRGIVPYLQARIYAILGDKERAVNSLSQAIKEGMLFAGTSITFDLDFAKLKDEVAFQELIQPR